MMYTITISNLDNYEADHISSILSEYRSNLLQMKLEAIIEDLNDGGSRIEWYDEHLSWHDSIMTKVKWSQDV
jgi:hypothetical protein